jgi:internalin A
LWLSNNKSITNSSLVLGTLWLCISSCNRLSNEYNNFLYLCDYEPSASIDQAVIKVFDDNKSISREFLRLRCYDAHDKPLEDNTKTSSQGCIIVQRNSGISKIAANLFSGENRKGSIIDLKQFPSLNNVITAQLLNYNDIPFDAWVRCGDFQVNEPSIYFQVVLNEASSVSTKELSPKLINADDNKESTLDISDYGCIRVPFGTKGTITLTDNKSYIGEYHIKDDTLPNELYSINLKPFPSNRELCIKNGTHWKWNNNQCLLKNFYDYCTSQHILDSNILATINLFKKSFNNEDCGFIESQLKSLSILDFTERQNLSDIYPLVSFSHFKVLKLANNRIIDLKPIHSFENLQELYISENQLVSLSDMPVSGSLKVLSAWGNFITNIDILHNLNDIEELYLHNNHIKDISSLENLSKLKIFRASNNFISDISPLKKMTSLEELYLAYNEIKDISALSNMTSLKKLTLSFNYIESIDALSALENIEILYLWGNKISSLAPISRFNKLKILYITGNNISDISALDGTTELTELYATDNQISDISILRHQKKLKKLSLINNKINDLTPLRELPDIKVLELQGNPINSKSNFVDGNKCPKDALSEIVRDFCNGTVDN